MKVKYLFSIKFYVAALFTVCFLCSCSNESRSEFFAMDTIMNITAYGKNADAAAAAAKSEILRIDSELDRKNKTSKVYKLNEAGYSDDKELYELLSKAVDICAETNGGLDITTEPLSEIWGFYDSNYRIPSLEETETAKKYTDYRFIKLSGGKISLTNSARIDLGAVAKGYSADRAAEKLRENGISSAILSLGGNVRAVGKKTDGSDWRVGIQDPDDTNKSIALLDINDKSVVTSGSYQRYFEKDGKIYHHIMDPKTGRPAESGLSSVTVICSDGTRADALSTAFFVMGLERSEEYLKNNNDIKAVFISNDGTLFYSKNLKIQSFAKKSVEIEE